MSSIRQEKINSLIKRELAQIFQQESRGLFQGAFITVTTVRVSPDLGNCKVYLSFMAVADKEAALDMVKDQSWKIRQQLGSKVGKQLRKIPELAFFIDDSLDYYDEIDRLLKK
ncbi:MAG: 30S ribosome-binding factor RbfA [Flavobacteriales bacterium]|nr:30S ribosome-binding factor RbfA [Flavobacteriales bacterium]